MGSSSYSKLRGLRLCSLESALRRHSHGPGHSQHEQRRGKASVMWRDKEDGGADFATVMRLF